MNRVLLVNSQGVYEFDNFDCCFLTDSPPMHGDLCTSSRHMHCSEDVRIPEQPGVQFECHNSLRLPESPAYRVIELDKYCGAVDQMGGIHAKCYRNVYETFSVI